MSTYQSPSFHQGSKVQRLKGIRASWDHGSRGMDALQSLYRTLTRPNIDTKPCPICDKLQNFLTSNTSSPAIPPCQFSLLLSYYLVGVMFLYMPNISYIALFLSPLCTVS